MSVRLRPAKLREARAFVGEHHRHNDPPRGHLFSVAVDTDDGTVGVAIASRPVARAVDDGRTIEIVRVCVLDDAPRNTCSMLYGALCRAAAALGYTRALTYTLASEVGTSPKAAGFRRVAELPPRHWGRERKLAARQQLALDGEPDWESQPRHRWERRLT